ncbi:MAG: tetratricopeptide repeat protein [Gemmatimonadota bacterium]|nr:tetratricopeptide repeat protein [Gemmatimonadota bacterium]
MAIKGSLKEASLPDVLQLLAMGKKTGCLSVNYRTNFGYIYFDKGRISYASIVNRRDRLGDMLVKNGIITADQLRAAIDAQERQRDRRIGELLMDMGYLSRDALRQHIREQIEEAVYFLFTWNQGSFNFEADVQPEEQEFLVSINPESLLLEGARRVDEWTLVEKKIPTFDIVFEIDRPKLARSDVELTDEQRALLELVDGRRDVQQIIDASGMGEFDVGKLLYGLATAGFLHRIGTSKAAEPAVSEARVQEHYNLGVAFYKTGMFDEALREFRRVLDLRAGDASARFYIGLVALRQERWADALATYEEATARPGSPAAVYHNMAYALERLGRLGEAQRALQEAAKRSGGHNPFIQTSTGIVALLQGDLAAADEALRAARPLWAARPPSAGWYHHAALAAALLGDLARAQEILDEGIGAHPHNAVLHNNLGVVLERRNNAAAAAQALERALAEDASVPQIHKNLGDVAYRTGQFDDALASYQRAVKADPELGDDVYLKLGNIRFRQHRKDEAIKLWERALAIDPDNAIVRTNLDAVRQSPG